MSLDTLEIGEVLTVRTYKTVPGAELAWANTYEVVNKSATTNREQSRAAIELLVEAIKNFERTLLNEAYTLDRIVVSTYVPDGTPYNPFTFTVFPINLPGQYYTTGNPLLPLQLCALIKRNVSFGRAGNLLMRGIVTANDAIITPQGAKISNARLVGIRNVINNFLSSIDDTGFDLCMARGSQFVETGTLRIVQGLEIKSDMTFKQLNNRYFDKTRTTN